MFRHLPILTFAVVVASGLVGCNTEQMWARNDRPEGPAARMDSVDGAKLPDIQVVDAQEVDLVENMATHRAMYRRMLVALRDYYRDRGYHNKMQWADSELVDLDRVKPFKYILSAEIPVNSLRPRLSIAEADEMFAKGVDLMKKGGHGLPVLYRQDLMLEALNVFTDLITKYPSSDKIDDAAFCCGEILKEYFQDQERLAVKWYERAHDWDPRTVHPALFQAAVVYDYRLHDRSKALELYHRVLEEETENKSNAAFASRRVYELTEGIKQLSEPIPPANAGIGATPAALTGDAKAQPETERPAPGGAVDEPRAADGLVPVLDLGPDHDE